VALSLLRVLHCSTKATAERPLFYRFVPLFATPLIFYFQK
jgi:hypothetical protein